MKKKVILGLSGGVDSSVAAYLLLKDGYDVEGLFMRNWDSATNNDVLGNPTVTDDICPQEQDYLDALSVAEKLGIKLHRIDFVKEYWDHVFTYFISEYKLGRTPNPDILCNKYIKFDAFYKEAKRLGADFIAMGHYARVVHNDKYSTMLRGVDSNKDQSYFLSQVTSEQLREVLFPVGDIDKTEVRKIAIDNDIPTASKKDSTGICFIGERDFNKFLDNYLPATNGNIVTDKGVVIGSHSGLMYYTIGQRKGLGIGGSNEYGNEPWFVIGKSLSKNELYVGQGFHHEVLYSTSCIVKEVNWIYNKRFDGLLNCSAKFRYRQSDNDVSIEWIDSTSIKVQFNKPIRAVTPGQAAVFYDGDICLGGGFIDEVFKDGKKCIY